jgi:hypothetical protein
MMPMVLEVANKEMGNNLVSSERLRRFDLLQLSRVLCSKAGDCFVESGISELLCDQNASVVLLCAG